MSKNKNLSIINSLILFVLICFIFISFSTLDSDSYFMKTIITTAEFETKEYANDIINKSINETIDNMNVSYNDFLIKTNEYNFYSISANTILINKFCTELNNNILKKLNNNISRNINIPFGSVFGIEIFSNLGPDINFEIVPIGNTLVNYETSFESVGINQTNFKIWIDIVIVIKIVNPLQKKELQLNRKVMLINTIINGDIPNNYINIK